MDELRRTFDHTALTKVVAVTGSGISAPSGLATYRSDGARGWSNERHERLSHASRYGNHLDELWGFWGRTRQAMLDATPNAAHQALADWEDHLTEQGGWLTVVTQNVDGLHQRAGSNDVVEIHGTLMRSRCMRGGCRTTFDDTTVDGVPTCPACGKQCRPDSVLFGEALDPTALRYVRRRLTSCDLCVYVGTSGQVWPVAGFGQVAAQYGAATMLVDRRPWDDDPGFDLVVTGDCADTLPQIVGQLAGPNPT